jgi:hypothetical protein
MRFVNTAGTLKSEGKSYSPHSCVLVHTLASEKSNIVLFRSYKIICSVITFWPRPKNVQEE